MEKRSFNVSRKRKGYFKILGWHFWTTGSLNGIIETQKISQVENYRHHNENFPQKKKKKLNEEYTTYLLSFYKIVYICVGIRFHSSIFTCKLEVESTWTSGTSLKGKSTNSAGKSQISCRPKKIATLRSWWRLQIRGVESVVS